MPFEPDKIKKEHVIEAAKIIDSGEYEIAESTGYDVVIDTKRYPPKEIMRLAHEQATGEFLWHPGGGEPTNKYLKALGFEIIEKKNTDPWIYIINDYKNIISKNGNDKEIYKWKLILNNSNKLNTTSPDFFEDIKSVKFQNLVYHNGIAALNHMTKDFPEDIRNCFKDLFNEANPLSERIDSFTNSTLQIYRRVEPKLSHHQDERTIATYLTFKYPSKYTFYKDSFYRKLCKRLNIPSEKKGKKYIHYLSLISDFIKNYIEKDEVLLNLKNSFLTPECFKDENNLIFAQDILYQSLDNPNTENKKFWRIGTKDGDDSYWEEMYEGNYVSIGWSKIGDLSSKDIKDKNDIISLLNATDYAFKNNSTKSRKAGEIFNFYDAIKIGDIVLAQDGDTILGIGEVIEDYEFEANQDFPHSRNVKWIVPNLKNFYSSEGRNTTVYEITDEDKISEINNLLNSQEILSHSTNQSNMTKSLNTIMFGPPGTGKTYNSINYALEIIGEDLEGKTRFDIKNSYDAKVKEGQIVFTTFHQSMSYEDFIEGIKPQKPENDEKFVKYKIEDGIFRIACARAAYLCYKKQIKSKGVTTSNNFEDLYAAFTNSIIPAIKQGRFPIYKTKTGKDVEIYEINSQNSIKARAKGSIATNVAPLTEENLEKLYNKFSDVSQINDLQQIRDTVEVSPRSTEFFAVFRGIKEFEKTFQPDNYITEEEVEIDLIEDPEKLKKFSAGVYNEAIKEYGRDAEPVVLIIDEINRGNVSQIFGELITLIEDDKRFGKTESLEITLPYSKMKFSVPPNLFLIGTMNTADRSVEALDTALRRRFSFIEMMPDYSILKSIDEIDLAKVLKTINKRLCYLINEDHQIGHSYFIGITKAEELEGVFENKIIPLLKEYFYNDASKIQLVLGEGFVKKETKSKPKFAVKGNDVMDKEVYSIVKFDSNFNITEAIKALGEE
jgi:5-methylcytosine-specific restriction protein B